MDVKNNNKRPPTIRRAVWLTTVLSLMLMTPIPVLAGAANYSYDPLGRITQVVYTDGSTTTTITYQYDASGNRTSVVTTRSP